MKRQKFITSNAQGLSARFTASENRMGLSDLRTDDDGSTGSKTYIEFHSDGSQTEKEAYQLVRRGGRLREGVEDIDELYAQLTPLLASAMFDGEKTGMLEWLEVSEEDIEAYQDGVESDD